MHNRRGADRRRPAASVMSFNDGLPFKCIRTLLGVGLLLAAFGSAVYAEKFEEVRRMLGPRDAIVVRDARGQLLLAQNEEKQLIPASTLKVLTSLVALNYLGAEYRFPTDFYLDNDNNLIIKGYGDPLLISEVVAQIGRELAGRMSRIENIVLDDTHFVQPLEIPGISTSEQPYDAPNGALCVNFNTVFFERRGGRYISAEPQTPLLDFALQRVQRSSLPEGRVVFTHREKECTLYAGHLFRHFMQAAGIDVRGRVMLGAVGPTDALVYRHVSPFTVEEIVAKLLEHSNNFTTNQLLIAAGVEVFGPPGNLDNGVLAAKRYARLQLGLHSLQMVEGSGISRANRISARDLCRVLDVFAPYRHLMRNEGPLFYKTGTLHGISTRAGYIGNENGEQIRFAILVNTPGMSSSRILQVLRKTMR